MLCGSWVVVDKQTGAAVFETFDPRVAAAINRAKYNVICAYDYLVRLHKLTRLQKP